MAPKKPAKAKKPAPKKAVAKAPAKTVSAPAVKPAAPMAKGESCSCCGCSSSRIWTGIIALIIGAAAGYILSTL